MFLKEKNAQHYDLLNHRSVGIYIYIYIYIFFFKIE